MRRFMAIWFPYLPTERMIRHRPELKNAAFVLAAPDHGRTCIIAVSNAARLLGVRTGMVAADARALVAGLQVINAEPGPDQQLLTAIGHWCIHYTPAVSVDLPDGLLLDVSGCTHLWGGEVPYASEIQNRLKEAGYTVRIAIAGTIGTAWALARYGKQSIVLIPSGEEKAALSPLPPSALRLESAVVERLQKLGLSTIGHFIDMNNSVLRRRFGTKLTDCIGQALGQKEESLAVLQPIVPYREKLHCLEPIVTRTGIEIALQRLLDTLCERMTKEGKGLRKAIFKACRIDGEVQQIEIGTHLPSRQSAHLFKLFELKIGRLAPAAGIEQFVLEAFDVENARASQETLWHNSTLDDTRLAGLLDRLTGRFGRDIVHRYLPDEHYWPERSYKEATTLTGLSEARWPHDRPRPVRLLCVPERIEVAAPVPDYPPMHFRYRGQLHTVKRADGPERIEREWWIDPGESRDYYVVEDEAGGRFWLFRLGHYNSNKSHQWYLHGFFA